MYNMLFGENELADDLLKMLNLTKEDCGRYRDCYLDEKGEKIIVYTRNGGGNREYYEEVFDKLSSHTNYLCDYDDDFDCTYASIEFSVPDKFIELTKEFVKKGADTTTGSEKFKKLLDVLDKGEMKDE